MGEIAFFCSVLAKAPGNVVRIDGVKAIKGQVAASRLANRINAQVRRGAYMPGQRQMFLSDRTGFTAFLDENFTMSISVPTEEHVRTLVGRWLDRGYRVSVRMPRGDEPINDLEAALLECTAPAPGISPAATTTVTADGAPIAAVRREIMPEGQFVVTAGSTCPDPGGVERTVLILESTPGAMRCGVDGQAAAPATRVEIVVAGTDISEALVDALRFAARIIGAQHRRNTRRRLSRKK